MFDNCDKHEWRAWRVTDKSVELRCHGCKNVTYREIPNDVAIELERLMGVEKHCEAILSAVALVVDPNEVFDRR